MYNVLAKHYDEMQGNVPALISEWVIATVSPAVTDGYSVLELGCGTGSVLAELPDSWRKTGVDISDDMLAFARVKLPAARLLEGDMLTLELGRTYDLVLCVFDTINHFLCREHWQKVFDVAARHLNPGGMFLFDMHTTSRMLSMPTESPLVGDLEDGTVLVQQAEPGSTDMELVWSLRFFEPENGAYTLTSEEVVEWSMPLEEVRTLIETAGLSVMQVLARAGVDADDNSARAFVSVTLPS